LSQFKLRGSTLFDFATNIEGAEEPFPVGIYRYRLMMPIQMARNTAT
jgi:hypothetical protein